MDEIINNHGKRLHSGDTNHYNKCSIKSLLNEEMEQQPTIYNNLDGVFKNKTFNLFKKVLEKSTINPRDKFVSTGYAFNPVQGGKFKHTWNKYQCEFNCKQLSLIRDISDFNVPTGEKQLLSGDYFVIKDNKYQPYIIRVKNTTQIKAVSNYFHKLIRVDCLKNWNSGKKANSKIKNYVEDISIDFIGQTENFNCPEVMLPICRHHLILYLGLQPSLISTLTKEEILQIWSENAPKLTKIQFIINDPLRTKEFGIPDIKVESVDKYFYQKALKGIKYSIKGGTARDLYKNKQTETIPLNIKCIVTNYHNGGIFLEASDKNANADLHSKSGMWLNQLCSSFDKFDPILIANIACYISLSPAAGNTLQTVYVCNPYGEIKNPLTERESKRVKLNNETISTGVSIGINEPMVGINLALWCASQNTNIITYLPANMFWDINEKFKQLAKNKLRRQ